MFNGGACLWPPHATQQMIKDVCRHRPDVIFVHMRENDLGCSPPPQILSDLLNFVNELAPLCSSHTVILGQLMHFPNNAHMDDAVDFINVRLSEDLLPPGHIFWRHRSGLSRGANTYLADGAHLNEGGYAQSNLLVYAYCNIFRRRNQTDWSRRNAFKSTRVDQFTLDGLTRIIHGKVQSSLKDIVYSVEVPIFVRSLVGTVYSHSAVLYSNVNIRSDHTEFV